MRQLVEFGLANAAIAALCAAAVLLLTATRLGRSPALRHALWLLVLARLVMPPLWVLPIALDTSAPAAPEPPARIPLAAVVAAAAVETPVRLTVTAPPRPASEFPAAQADLSPALIVFEADPAAAVESGRARFDGEEPPASTLAATASAPLEAAPAAADPRASAGAAPGSVPPRKRPATPGSFGPTPKTLAVMPIRCLIRSTFSHNRASPRRRLRADLDLSDHSNGD